jgi:hypothetical protein
MMKTLRSSRASRLATVGILALGTATCLGQGARADLVLTAAGMAQNLSLSTFATGFPTLNGIGPLGVAFVNGTVLATDYPGNVRVFATDADGQNAASATIGQNYGATNAVDLAQVGNTVYMTRQAIGDVVQINANGTLNQVIVTGLSFASGMIANPANGHLFVGAPGANVIDDVDPIGKTKTVFVNQAADGLTISPDGKTLYAEIGGHILGFDTTTKAQVFDSGFISGGPDGAAVGTGLFAGQLFVNTNSGTVYEINVATNAQTLIATGGSRGDFVTVDPTNNTLLLTQTDRIVRLNGASFTAVPEPGPLVLAGVGALVGLGAYGWKRRRSRAALA